MKPVIVTADSACDLPVYVLKEHRVETVPLSIVLNDEIYLDDVTITPDDIYTFYDKTGKLPKTAAVSPGQYTELFEKYTCQGYAVVHLNLSSSISSCFQNALIAAGDFEDVFCVDSKNLFTGIGLLVLKACDLRDEGLDAQEIADRLENQKTKVKTTFVIDTLEFLYKGGRCSAVAKMGANLLNLKPCIEVADGKMGVIKKYRGKLDLVYRQYIQDRLREPAKIDPARVVVGHSGIPQAQIDQAKKMVENAVHPKEIIVARAGCTITSHCGPNTLAILYMEK